MLTTRADVDLYDIVGFASIHEASHVSEIQAILLYDTIKHHELIPVGIGLYERAGEVRSDDRTAVKLHGEQAVILLPPDTPLFTIPVASYSHYNAKDTYGINTAEAEIEWRLVSHFQFEGKLACLYNAVA